MPYMTEDECIIEEFLNNWFTLKELAEYLCTTEDEVIRALSYENVSTLFGKTKASKVSEHYKHITSYDPNDTSIKCEENYVKILKVADYIIENKASLRKTAEFFQMGKTTVFDWIYEKLPKISLIKYRQVYEVLMSNKSFNTNNKNIILQVLDCFTLLKMGLTESEISQKLNIGRNVVQRNLTYRLQNIDEAKYLEAIEILKKNQIDSIADYKYGKK